jgi:hypothetical protein
VVKASNAGLLPQSHFPVHSRLSVLSMSPWQVLPLTPNHGDPGIPAITHDLIYTCWFHQRRSAALTNRP